MNRMKEQQKQALEHLVVFPAVDVWRGEVNDSAISTKGNRRLLEPARTAFFASRRCPGTAIRAAMDWALAQVGERQTVISGFHSPLERSVLQLLLEAHSPAIVVLARSVESARLPREWRDAVGRGDLLALSADGTVRRLDEQRAQDRNELVAHLAERIVVAHAESGGTLEAKVAGWRAEGKSVLTL